RSLRERCERGRQLQAAREAAGFTHESLARRMVLLMRLPTHGGVGALSARDESTHIPHEARALEYMERASQGAYDRAKAWFERPVHERQTGPRPRLRLRDYDQAFAAIALGPPSMSATELHEA